MTRFIKSVVWFLAVCLVGIPLLSIVLYLAAGFDVVPAPGEARAQAPAAGTDPPPVPAKVMEPAVDGVVVVYPFKTPDPQNDARRLQAQYFDRANITIAVSSPGASSHPHLMVRAPADVQAEIRAVVGFLTGQQSEPTDASGSAGDSDSMMSMAAPRQATQYGYLGLAQLRQQAAQERIRAARQSLSDAKTDADKQAARAQLRQLLADVFAQDMQMREKQAAEIEARLAKLRQQYQARAKVKDEIIDLQLKVIEQDAAGLGFPGGNSTVATPRATPPTPVRSGSPLGNRSNLPASDTPNDPMIRGGQSGANVPATRVDQHDPIRPERKLGDLKKTHALVVANLKTAGHFIESDDGNLYAYANVTFPSGPSDIRVVDSATGKLVATATLNSAAGPLVFTEEGVATRESFNIPSLRVPLKKPPVTFSPRFDSGGGGANPFDPMATALDPEFLKKYPTEPQTRVGELSARGHFVGSPDGKLYAYVETKGDGIPEGTAEIRVCDVRTGQRLAAAKIKAPVGKLRFFNEGVATEDTDGTLKLLISFSQDHDTQDVLETTIPDKSGSGATNRPTTSSPSTPALTPEAAVVSEYNELRSQYRKAKAPLALAESQFNTLVAEAQKQKPNTSVDDVKKQHPIAWQAVERARPDFEAAHRLLETKLELLILDRKSATLTLDAAKAEYQKLSELYKKNAATMSEVTQQFAAMEAAELNVERVGRLIALYESIRSDPTPTSNAPAPGAGSGDQSPSDDPVTLSETVRQEALAMLQGTWNCVAAGAKENQLRKEELVGLALQLTIKGDDVTISYVGDDLKRQETAGKLLVDTSTSPPTFNIDIHVLGIQAQSRLSGVTRIDRSVLHMHRPGGTFLIHRKFESEPSMFEFKRPRSDSAQPTDESKSAANPAARVPKERTAEMVTVRDMLSFMPETAGIDYDQPAPEEIDTCRVVLEPGAATGANGTAYCGNCCGPTNAVGCPRWSWKHAEQTASASAR
jgi:hypothetical protein